MNTDIQNNFMSYAITLALKGQGKTSPNPMVGCVIVKNGRIIGEGYHEKYGEHHAEVNAFKNCSETPEGSDLYVTLEPCVMCAGAIHQSRLTNVVYGTKDPKGGAMGSLYKIHEDQRLNHQVNVENDVLQEECSQILKDFFAKRR